MRRPLVLLVLALVLAGCASPAARPTTTTTPLPGASSPFVGADLGEGGPEPVVRVTPEGDVVVAAQDPQGGGPRVWSASAGSSSFALARPTTQGGGEVDLAVGAGGLRYVTQLGTSGNVVSVSRDGGQTWSTSPLGAQTTYFDREWLGVDDAGRVYVVARPRGDNTVSQVSRSDDQGLTFLPQGNPWDAGHEPGLTNGPLAFWGAKLAMPYVCRDGNGVCVAWSADRGATWNRALVKEGAESVSHVYASLAATSDGLVVAWAEPVAGRLAVFTSFSSDAASWSAPRRVSGPDESALEPWVAAGPRGAWVVYLATPAKLAAGDDAAAASAAWTPVALRLDARGAPQGAALLLADAVHEGAVSPPVARGSGAPQNRLFGDFFTASLDRDGKLVVALEKDAGLGGASHVLVVRER